MLTARRRIEWWLGAAVTALLAIFVPPVGIVLGAALAYVANRIGERRLAVVFLALLAVGVAIILLNRFVAEQVPG